MNVFETIAAGAVAALLLAACKAPETPPEPPRAVHVVRVEPGNGTISANYTGDVRARYETALGFRVGGKITGREVEIGDAVKAGQVLMRLDPGDQRLGVKAAADAVAAAEASHTQAGADFKRFGDLYRQGFVSAAEFDRRRTTLEVAAAQLAQARAQLALTRNQSDYTTLKAGADGIVTAILAEVGQVVGAGQAVARVARPGHMDVAVSIPENRLGEVRKGLAVRVNLWAAPERFYEGRVREVSPVADPVTRTYLAKVTLLDAGGDIQLGMTANVFLEGAEPSSTVRLPSTALFQKGSSPAVWVVDPATSQVSLRAVKVGRFAEDHITIVEGLQPGDTVVRAGVQKLFANEKVRILADRGP